MPPALHPAVSRKALSQARPPLTRRHSETARTFNHKRSAPGSSHRTVHNQSLSEALRKSSSHASDKAWLCKPGAGLTQPSASLQDGCSAAFSFNKAARLAHISTSQTLGVPRSGAQPCSHSPAAKSAASPWAFWRAPRRFACASHAKTQGGCLS